MILQDKNLEKKSDLAKRSLKSKITTYNLKNYPNKHKNRLSSWIYEKIRDQILDIKSHICNN